MSIKLLYMIQRNGVSTADFLKKNKINSYEELLSYCKRKGCSPLTKEEYEEAAILLKSDASVQLEDAKEQKPKTKPATKRNANANKARRKKSNRSPNSKVSDS